MSVTWEIRQGDCRELLRAMPDKSVHACITSPPYFGLRDYGVDGQIGLEATVEEYVALGRRRIHDDAPLLNSASESAPPVRPTSEPAEAAA